MQKPAFSTIELMVTLIVIMIIMASLVPSITKKLNTRSVNIGGTIGTSNSNIEFEPDCSHINSDCELCTIDTCMLCLKICPTGQYANTSDCTCKPCSDIFSSDCIACTNKKCKKCDSDTKYIDNNTCTICPIGSYCDSINKITCEEGKYTDIEGQTSCNDCEVGYKCTGGIKTPCEEGYYNSSTNQSSCLPCEKGYKCEGAKDKIQCTGNQYQDETTQSTCKTCATEGYYITDDRTSCTICEAGYYCPGNGTKTQCPAGTYSQAGAKECISCSAGTYSTTAGATDVTTCQSCSSKNANCTECDIATGACTTCGTGYKVANGSCQKIGCGSLALKVTLSGEALCVTKYNIGDVSDFPLSGVNVVNTGGSSCSPSSTNLCCWKGTTGANCDSNNGGYSGCYRTVCDYWAANKVCQNLTYQGKTWRLPTSSEWQSIGSQITSVSAGQGSAGLMLCDYNANTSSARCTTTTTCNGAYKTKCNPYDVWSSSSGVYYNLTGNKLYGPYSDRNTYAYSVRCISEY